MRQFRLPVALTVLAASLASTPLPAWAWDSAKFEWLTSIVHPTHTYLTEFAIAKLKAEHPEVSQYASVLIEGANQELHELPIEGTLYGLDLDAKRKEHKGTNAGSDDVEGWWDDAVVAYAAGNKEQAWFITGIMLHMIEDMGVPAHANGVYHQGNASEFDNFGLSRCRSGIRTSTTSTVAIRAMWASRGAITSSAETGPQRMRRTMMIRTNSPRPGSPPTTMKNNSCGTVRLEQRTPRCGRCGGRPKS
jgi:hypothetical protein